MNPSMDRASLEQYTGDDAPIRVASYSFDNLFLLATASRRKRLPLE